jgi:hypothetical protein
MKKKRALRITIIMISILLAYFIYAGEYNIKAEQSDIERGIEEFLDIDVTIVDFKEIDNTLAVYYTLGSNDSIGFTALHKGINSRYQIRNAGYSTRNTVLQGIPFETENGEYLAVLGTNYQDRIANIKFQTYSGEIFTQNVQGESEILTVVGVEEPAYLDDYQLYDEHGNDITEEMKTFLTTDEGSSTGVGKAELFLLYVYCFFVILLGYGISRIFQDKDRKSTGKVTLGEKFEH